MDVVPRRFADILAIALILAAIPLAGCVRSLREPPPLLDTGAALAAHAPAEVDSLLGRAGILYARRTLDGVHEAAEAFLAAARADAGRVEGLVGTVRTRIWLVDHETDPDRRLQSAAAAVQAAQWCGRAAPADAACDYWLGAALGVQARERPSTGLDALPRIVEAFKRAAAAAPDMENAGPDRALALLYARAPGWPAGPGDVDLAIHHARLAATRSPDYPPNLLALAETLDAWGGGAASRATYRRALSLARGRSLAGDPDAQEWIREADEALKRLQGE